MQTVRVRSAISLPSCFLLNFSFDKAEEELAKQVT
jgi:hypothetical protein